MDILTERNVIKAVPDQWYRQYAKQIVGEQPDSGKREVYLALIRLDLSTCSAADVDRVIGNDSWTKIQCDNCGRRVDKAAEMGEPRDWESATAILCLDCLRAAVKAIEEAD